MTKESRTRTLILALPILALAGCSGQSNSTTYTADVGLIQTDWPQVEAIASIYTVANPSAAAGITKIEGQVTPLVAALSSTAAPSNLSTILADMNTIIASIPSCAAPPASQSGCVSLRTKADISAALAAVTLGQGLLAGL